MPPHYNSGKNQIKLEQSKLRLFQLAGGWGEKKKKAQASAIQACCSGEAVAKREPEQQHIVQSACLPAGMRELARDRTQEDSPLIITILTI